MKKAIVIGSGVGGLAVSIRLAHKGYQVIVYESNTYPGGKLTSIDSEGFRFDAGPSLFTLPHLVEELFTLCGENRKDYFEYKKCKDICHYFWDDGQHYVMPANTVEQIDSISDFFGVDKYQVEKYLNSNTIKYDKTKSIFLERSLHKVQSYLSLDVLRGVIATPWLDLYSSMNDVNSKHFGKNTKLVQLFNRYATYNGSSPYKTPGVMSMIPHLEMNLGTYFPKNGMKDISDSLYRLALKMGVDFHFNSRVDAIQHGTRKVDGILVNNTSIKADVVVSNADVSSTYEHLLKTAKQPKKHLLQERSSSALIFYWGMNMRSDLGLHNIFFSNDYEKEFDHIFNKKSIFEDPTIYVNITSTMNAKDAPQGCENWFVMINTPGDFGQDWDTLIANVKHQIINKLNKILSVNITDHIVCESILTPSLIASRTSSLNGSLYGTSSNNLFSAFLRHPNFSAQFKNLFFVGGSVHPGGGIPLCLNSAKIVANLINT